MTRQFKKQIETQSQSGRSMIEMLGVLAIIAILSIGGIVGYRLAMNYYQASQIAHEMNIMRTDAQIKIAQGTEKLMLGSPYDDAHKINFNDYGTDFGCLDMETETSEPELASCAVANAYYIEMQKIPEGVCKPLANLIDNMDNEIAFYINGNSVDAEAAGEKGACGEGLNTLKVIFGADSDSNAVKCNDDSDCPDNLPICLNHMCVECETDEDCTTDKPKCEQSTNTCKSCAEIDPEKPLWIDNECKACPEDQPWNGEFCGCRDNGDCSSDKFCLSVGCKRLCTDRHQSIRVTENCSIKKCVSINSYTQQNQDSTVSYIMSNQEMNWWSAKRFCEAQEYEKNMLRISKLECKKDTIGYHDGLEGIEERGPCVSQENPNEVSRIIKALRKVRFGNETQIADEWYWLKDAYAENRESEDSCNVYQVHLDGSVFYGDFRFNNGYALCEP